MTPRAVLFDVDGVVTGTAQAHAAAWKRLFDEYLEERARRSGEAFEPFDPVRDYRKYVDGRPRHDGVRGFLSSRGIELPRGSDEDAPERETVCGLGSRKNREFQAWLATHRVRPYAGTLRLIGELRASAIPVAAFSASRNADAVLRSAGVADLFDARVDGSDLARLGLPGKPDPAMLLEAARRLGVPPARCAVVEDAIAGVEAAARGGFGLVIGVARDAGGDALKAAGAHRVVRDAGVLRFTADMGLSVRTLAGLPSVWDCEDEVRRRLAACVPAVFLDYDGTLTPIVEDHAKALLDADMRRAVAELGRHCPVTIVSGRDLGRLRELVELDTIFLAGSHGFEIAGPHGSGESLEAGGEFLTVLDEAEASLLKRLGGIEGHSLERKRFSIAVHYRRVAQKDVATIRSIVDGVLTDQPRLRLGHGKKVFEIRPDMDWDKGRAVFWILRRLESQWPGAVPLYVGDDITDEDAFEALAGRGLCIAVRHDEARQTAADYTVANTQEVKRLLEWVTAIVAGQ